MSGWEGWYLRGEIENMEGFISRKVKAEQENGEKHESWFLHS